jgi:hypothetical protein
MTLAKKINLKDGENIIAVFQPYVLTYAWKYLVGSVFLFVSSFFMFQLFFYGWWGDILYVLGMASGLYIIVQTWLMSHNNLFILTSSRVVDLRRFGWFDEMMSSVSYLDIRDVVVRKKGIWQSLFNFGGVAIAGKSEQFILEVWRIANPGSVQTLISDLAQQYTQNTKVANIRAIYNSFVKIIPYLPDGQLQEVQRRITEQLGPSLRDINSK